MLKTTNFEIRLDSNLVKTLPEAYAVIRRMSLGENDMMVAYLGIYDNRDLARNHRSVEPIREEKVDFKAVRGNEYEIAYATAKTPYVIKTLDFEDIIKYPFFYGWDDDIVSY